MIATLSRFLFTLLALPAATFLQAATSHIDGPFESDIQPLLQEYCVECHGGKKVKGNIDFTIMTSPEAIEANFEIWELVSDVLAYQEMPPEEEDNRPTSTEIQQIQDWYQQRFIQSVEARPGPFKPRRLSAPEYRNTLRSLFGFDLETTIMAAEQTETEPSLVLKLLPTDPPGNSGFINDTHAAPLSSHAWEQYAYLADRVLQELFSLQRLDALETLIGENLPPAFRPTDLSPKQAKALLLRFTPRALRRPQPQSHLDSSFAHLNDLSGLALVDATQTELKALLVSPAFLYRGLLFDGQPAKTQRVDANELAERLSYFLWEDMPDERLLEAAANGTLDTPDGLTAQIDRMLASPKSISLAQSFGAQWLGLADIDNADNDVNMRRALRSQPYDFLNYLFTENRPVMELIDSKTTFANYVTASFYPKDKVQMVKYKKPKGIEKQTVPNQRLTLTHDEGRGGILTMPGILAMNKSPILRGTWVLRKILGERLGDPPDDVPPIEIAGPKANLTFRERFEQHRSDPTCARCHDKIDPLGFAMQVYDDRGVYKLDPNYKTPKRAKEHDDPAETLDTSGQLPSGETFANYEELQSILIGAKRPDIIRNAVECTLAYALARKLEAYDRPTIDAIAESIDETNGTWRDLFIAVSQSLPFQKTYVSAPSTPKRDS